MSAGARDTLAKKQNPRYGYFSLSKAGSESQILSISPERFRKATLQMRGQISECVREDVLKGSSERGQGRPGGRLRNRYC